MKNRIRWFIRFIFLSAIVNFLIVFADIDYRLFSYDIPLLEPGEIIEESILDIVSLIFLLVAITIVYIDSRINPKRSEDALDGLDQQYRNLYEPQIASLLKSIRARAIEYRLLSLFTLVLGFASLGVGLFVFVSADSVRSSPTTNFAREVEEMTRQLDSHSSMLSLSFDTIDEQLDDILRHIATIRDRVSGASRSYQELVSDHITGLQEQGDGGPPIAIDQDVTQPIVDGLNAVGALRDIRQIALNAMSAGDIDDLSGEIRWIRHRINSDSEDLRNAYTVAYREVFGNDNTMIPRPFDARWVSEIITRIGSIAFVLFAIQYLGARYIYLARQSIRYDEMADRIELISHHFSDDSHRRDKILDMLGRMEATTVIEAKVNTLIDSIIGAVVADGGARTAPSGDAPPEPEEPAPAPPAAGPIRTIASRLRALFPIRRPV